MPDLIVIGAGLAGSSLAGAMARRGWRVLLVERRPFPRHKVCGEFLSPEALHSLTALGLHEAVSHLSPESITEARLISPGGVDLPLPLPGQAWGISRYGLDQALVEAARAAGAEVRSGVGATHITPLPRQGYTVAIDGTWTSARVAAAAWGRQTLPSLRVHAPPPPKQAWVGLKRHYRGLTKGNAVEIYLIPGGYLGLAPVEGDRQNCSALVSHGTFRQVGSSPEAFFTWASQQNPALGKRLKGGAPVAGTDVTTSGVTTGQRPTPWSILPLLGDAAAVIPPLVGDGMAIALRSAELLVPLLEQHLEGQLSRAGLAAAYSQAYRQEFTRRLQVARWVQRGLVHPLGREGLLRLGRAAPGLAMALLLATRGPVQGQGPGTPLPW